MLVVPLLGNGTLQEILRRYFRLFRPTYHLYVNDYSPTLASDRPDFIEATYPGYSSLFANFTMPAPQQDFPFLYFRGEPLVFKPTSSLPTPQRMYGYYVTDFISSNLIWAERFPRRVFLSDPRDSIVVIPKFGALSEFSG